MCKVGMIREQEYKYKGTILVPIPNRDNEAETTSSKLEEQTKTPVISPHSEATITFRGI